MKKTDNAKDITCQSNGYYAAIDLGTNSCRLVIAEPTPSSFHVVETFSRVTRLGEGIINGNMLSKPAIRRTVSALKVCRAILDEYTPMVRMRFVATAACRRALNCREFENTVQKETNLPI
ncbi:MAG: Ppx/GppA family phosphatase, partial [Alphaproteobacteria bacterium]|nr:Ppx/GppA family phosphatase [Alphaproteobacteria bacterium]